MICYFMARGQQKIQSQVKNAKKLEQMRKANAVDQKTAAQKALHYKCIVCFAQMPDPKTYKQHFQNKHPKASVPAELVDVQI